MRCFPARRGFIAVALLALLVVGSAAIAQPVPTVNSPLIPIQRGQTLEVTVNGANLSNVASVGIKDPQGLDVSLVKPEKPDNAKATLRIVAAPDATPGNREFRLVSPTGVSNPLRVVVDQFPPLAESEPNDAPHQAQTAVLPAVLTGQIGHPGDADCFRFDARKGQCIVIDLHASRDGSPLDAAIAIYDSAGKELASDNDTHGPDPFLAFTVPADGSYVLEVRDLQFRGGGEYRYRVKCGHFPYVSALFPITSQRGRVVDVKAVGHNLYGADTVKLDLTYATPGRVNVRVSTPLGVSNALPFEVTDAPPTPEAEPNDAADKATPLPLPADVSGVISKGDDEDFFRFTVPQKQMVNLEVSARRLGSPVDALLTLRNAKGDVIETNDDAAGADARITRELEAGDYVASVRDLVYAGGPDHAYRLSVEPTLAPPQNFSLRFQPDAIRVHRGGHAAVWCDVARQNGFAGDVTVTLEGLPRGVTAQPVTLGGGSSGFFTISAAADASLGSAPVRLRGSAVVGGRLVTREADPELNGRPVQQAYLTVLEPAPFTVETPAVLEPPRLQQLAGEISAVAAKLTAPDPALDAAQAEWEKKVLASAVWTPLEFAETTSANGAAVTFAKQPDGSVLVGGTNPDMDNYTLVAHTDVKGVVAVRLEVLSDPALPSMGPGRAVNGNFVLTGLSLLASPKADGAKAQKVSFNKSKATFSQQNYPVEHAVDDERDTGWAIVPQTGRSHTAIFFTAAPVGADGGTTLKFQLEQVYGQQHTIGKFRVSVTTDGSAADAPSVPAPVLAVVKTPADKRSAEQKAQLTAYYRTIDPKLAAGQARLEGLRTAVAPHAEVARLEGLLAAQTPQLDAEQARWERAVAAGATWVPVELTGLKSSGGATLTAEPDRSVFAGGATPATDTYTLTGASPVRGVTAVRLEVLPDPRLPNNGPGRGKDGNFVLTRFAVAGAPKADPSKATPVELHSPVATFEQQGWGAAGLLDERNDTGWAVHPNVGRPAAATFLTRSQIAGGEDTLLTFTLEHQSQFPQDTIGRLRVWVTNALRPEEAPKLPESVLAILRNPNRDDGQKAALAAYFRSIAPSLEPVRQRLAELRAAAGPTTPATRRNQGGAIPVLVTRQGDFTGDVKVTLEGFTAGREGAGPRPIDRSLKFSPLVVAGAGTFGTLNFQADANAEQGTRTVVLRAEAKVGDSTVVQYSPAFPLTVR